VDGWLPHFRLNISLGLLFQLIQESLSLDLMIRSRSTERSSGKVGVSSMFLAHVCATYFFFFCSSLFGYLREQWRRYSEG